jgi:hypothetical protein
MKMRNLFDVKYDKEKSEMLIARLKQLDKDLLAAIAQSMLNEIDRLEKELASTRGNYEI